VSGQVIFIKIIQKKYNKIISYLKPKLYIKNKNFFYYFCEKIKKMQLFFYNIIVCLVLPFTLVKLLYRGIKNQDYLKNWADRFAIYPKNEKDLWNKRKTLWIHCVSVGETKAIFKLLEKLQRKFPKMHFLITNGTPTGRKIELPNDKNVHRAYLPYDANFLVRKFLQFYQPNIGILVEKEIWPNLINQCKQKKIPLLLINGRLSDESTSKYLTFKNFYTPLVNKLSTICVQNISDKKNFQKLTKNKINVLGNLKFDQSPPKNTLKKSRILKRNLKLSKQTVIVLGSSRDGEEEIILHQILTMNMKDITLILVPRHPERFDKVADILQSKKIKFIRRSQSSIVKNKPRVLLGDSMDEMYLYYSLADIVIVGGSFLSYGSQNPIEALKMKKPTIIGPSIYNFKNTIIDATKANAIMQIKDINKLPLVIKKLRNKKAQQTLINNAKEFIMKSEGSSSKTIKIISQYL